MDCATLGKKHSFIPSEIIDSLHTPYEIAVQSQATCNCNFRRSIGHIIQTEKVTSAARKAGPN